MRAGSHCDRCATHCVLVHSAVKCVHGYALCGYCNLCTGYFEPEPNALNKLLIAGFYEQNKLLIDAGTAYLEAIKLAPDVPQYKEAYNDFLLRYGLKKPSEK